MERLVEKVLAGLCSNQVSSLVVQGCLRIVTLERLFITVKGEVEVGVGARGQHAPLGYLFLQGKRSPKLLHGHGASAIQMSGPYQSFQFSHSLFLLLTEQPLGVTHTPFYPILFPLPPHTGCRGGYGLGRPNKGIWFFPWVLWAPGLTVGQGQNYSPSQTGR